MAAAPNKTPLGRKIHCKKRLSSRLVFIARLNELELKNSRSDNDFSLSLSLLITKSAPASACLFSLWHTEMKYGWCGTTNAVK
jgi:hypothetical protein